MAKFNLYAHEGDITVPPTRRTADGISPRTFGLGLGVWFGLMFVLACLIVTA